jgi:hypothetical protein
MYVCVCVCVFVVGVGERVVPGISRWLRTTKTSGIFFAFRLHP